MHKSNKTLATTLLTQCRWPPGRAICDSHVYLTFSAVFHGWREHKRPVFLFFLERCNLRRLFSGAVCVCCVSVWALPVGCSSYSKCLRQRPACYILLTFQTSQHCSLCVGITAEKTRKERETTFWSMVFFRKFRRDERGETHTTWCGPDPASFYLQCYVE